MESFDGPKTNPDISQDTSITDDIEDSIEEEKDETSDEERDEEDWVDGRNFPFHEVLNIIILTVCIRVRFIIIVFLFYILQMPHTGGFVRPSSAREGSRLSKGQSDSSLRQTAMMQNFYTEYKSLNHKLEQVRSKRTCSVTYTICRAVCESMHLFVQITQERDSLKQSLARVESEKKQLIQEGEESILTIQRQNEAALRSGQTNFNSVRDFNSTFFSSSGNSKPNSPVNVKTWKHH